MKKPDGILRQAIIDGEYRYSLIRNWSWSKLNLLFVMLNPSKADETIDDATIRWCMSFARRWDFGGIEVCNLWPYRATNPMDLTVAITMGMDAGAMAYNDEALLRAFDNHSWGIAAWGCHEGAATRAAEVRALAASVGCKLWTLGLTADGSPRHPLRQRLDTVPAEYS
jgi:hypothetical protein